MRDTGNFIINSNYEVQCAGPFDARSVTGLKSDLTNREMWTVPAMYAGMLVSVNNDTDENNGVYVLKKNPTNSLLWFTDESNWCKLFTEEEFEDFNSNLQQDLSKYVTQEQIASYSKISINSTPEVGDENTIYFEELDGAWEEKIWYNGQFVKVGDSSVDLSNYYTKEEVDAKIEEVKSSIPDVSQFITSTVDNLINYYNKTEVDSLLSQLNSVSFKKVDSLPLDPQSNVIYLVPKTTTSASNLYTEYIYVDGGWEIIGSTEINLDGYVTTEQLTSTLQSYVTSDTLTSLLASKQDVLVSGTNIKTINGQSILGSGDILVSGGSSANIATTTTPGTILATDISSDSGTEVFVGVNSTDGRASVKIPSIAETSTSQEVVDLLNTDTIVIDGNN